METDSLPSVRRPVTPFFFLPQSALGIKRPKAQSRAFWSPLPLFRGVYVGAAWEACHLDEASQGRALGKSAAPSPNLNRWAALAGRLGRAVPCEMSCVCEVCRRQPPHGGR